MTLVCTAFGWPPHGATEQAIGMPCKRNHWGLWWSSLGHLGPSMDGAFDGAMKYVWCAVIVCHPANSY
eukprot:3253160-Pyramimonas_sp.AAC.4